jgi:hypothetical protein
VVTTLGLPAKFQPIFARDVDVCREGGG